MRNWSKYDKESIFRDKSKGGLLFLFLKEYKEEFNVNPIASCRKCLNSYWNNYLKTLTIMKTPIKCDYVLHKKYNGIQLGVNGQPIRNGEMTNEIAKELLEKHPRGEKLFSEIPDQEPVLDTDLSLADLRIKYPDVKSNSKDGFLEKLAELETSEGEE